VRVAFVMHVMQVAGAEMLVTETIRRLGGRIAPSIFCLDAVGPLGERLRAEGVDVACFDRRPGRDFGVAARMARALRQRSTDVVHAHQYTPFFYAAIARVLAGGRPRLVLTEHGRHFPDVVSPKRRAANRLVFDRLADAVNAVCGFSARALGRNDGFTGARIEVIENGVEVSRYGRASDRGAALRAAGLDPDRRYIACVARFHPVKDHAMLLRGFARVAAARGDADLLLVGDGPLRADLEAQARALGIAERVRFLGVRRDVPGILGATDVFTLTSVSEAASLTLLEAMASSLPVVVTAVGGNPEIVRDGVDGLLVPRGDDAALASALIGLLDDPARAARLGASGRSRVEERYRLERTVERYGRLYERLAGRA
jgi:glycosyltransferase involved in cell wall biosynthesis